MPDHHYVLSRRAELKSTTLERLAPGKYSAIAKKSGLSVSHVSRVMRGLRSPSMAVLERIAYAANVSLAQCYAYIRHSKHGQPRFAFSPKRRTALEAKLGITLKEIQTARMIAQAYRITPMGDNIDEFYLQE